jgi:glycosyltransferase involved in cell wall biosynthesis
VPMQSNARRITFLVWRDTSHPDGGGSEVYVERMAAWLAQQGHDVTIFCAAHSNAAPNQTRDGVRFIRRGGRLSVYAHGLRYLLSRDGRRSELIVDVHNGIPFCAPLVRRRGVNVLVHHVHREQWKIIYPGTIGRAGWWVESSLTPRLYRRQRYITVSESTKHDLGLLGVAPDRVAVICNGIDVPHPSMLGRRSATPRLCVLGRIVPHKQFDHALRVLSALGPSYAELSLDVIGDGWWIEHLQRSAEELGVSDRVNFHGHVPDAERDRILDESWLMLAPSVKEGWGIAIMEAAAHGLPTLAYSSAGGVTESILDGETGVLVDDLDDLIVQTRLLLDDHEARTIMGKKARERAGHFGWERSAAAFERHLLGADAQRLP